MVPRILIRMLIRFYTFCVILCDIINFLIFSLYESCQTLIQLIRPIPKKSIKNEIVLIVGAGRGIGREFAIQISILGATIICLDINSVDNESTVKNIRILGGKAYFYTCDITNKENVTKIMTVIKRELGIITMMFHCCGIPNLKKYSTDSISIKATMNLNILSYFWLLDEILPDMKNYKHGHIVFITSTSGLTGKKHQMSITVGQFAIHGIFESVLDNLVKEQLHNNIIITLAHVYPFIKIPKIDDENYYSIPTISHCFGEINVGQTVQLILDGVLRNKIEFSLPKYILYIEKLMKLLPRRVTMCLGEFVDTGVDYDNVQITL